MCLQKTGTPRGKAGGLGGMTPMDSWSRSRSLDGSSFGFGVEHQQIEDKLL